jgi:hypothetical protein
MMKKILLLIMAVLVVFPTTTYALSPEQVRTLQSGVRYFNTEADSVCSNIGIVNGSIDRFLQVLAYQESRGDPTAESGASTASGKYQYINSTWQARASLYGPAGQYPRAKLAPESVQDAVAYIEYTQKFRDLGNDFFKLAVSHFYPVALTDESKLDVVPPGNSITPRRYAEQLIQNMGTGLGSNISLKYTEAPEFDIWLTKAGGTAPSVNAGGAESGCDSSATGGTIVEIAQRELQSGANETDGSYLKYTGGAHAAWCAYFVSWVLNEAGKPFEGGTIAAVTGVLAYAQNKGYYHPKGESGFTPQPGDIAIYNEGLSPYPSHVNIVISYDAGTGKYTSIGGNEGNTIKQAMWDASLPALTGFMRIP